MIVEMLVEKVADPILQDVSDRLQSGVDLLSEPFKAVADLSKGGLTLAPPADKAENQGNDVDYSYGMGL